MGKWSFYEPGTGALLQTTFCGPASALEDNTPPGAQPLEGEYDHISQRVDLETGLVVSFMPDAPDADHEWSATARRWMLKPAVVEERMRKADAQLRVDQLERKSLRAWREQRQDPSNKVAADRLAAIDAEIESLVPVLRGTPSEDPHV